MKRQIKIMTMLIMFVIGLTACSGLSDGAQDLPSNQQVTLPAGQSSQMARPQFDLASAARQLGVTEEELRSALGPPDQGPPDFAAVAAELGVTQQDLMDAVGAPAGASANGTQPTSQEQPSSEQPSLQGQGLLFMPTLTIIIMITFVMQGSLILFSTLVIKEYKGVREAAIATFIIALSFLSIRLGNEFQAEEIDAGFISSLFTISGFLLFYLAICRFVGKPFNQWITYGFVPLAYLTLTLAWLFRIRTLPLIYPTATATLVLNFSSAFTLYRSNNTRRYRLAAYLTGIPLAIYGFIAIGRMFLGFVDRAAIVPGPTLSAITDVMALFIFSYLWSSGFILMISQRLQSDLNDLAMNDALTRVRNRRAMQNMLNFEMRRIENEVREFSIILLDVDHFKNVNDTYGHDIGDVVLKWLASTLQNLLRVQDVIARWGGEEFLILLPDTNLDEAMDIAERLRLSIDTSRVETNAGDLHITFSAGVSNSNSTRHVSGLCKIADQALYIAKETRNTVVSEESIEAIETGA